MDVIRQDSRDPEPGMSRRLFTALVVSTIGTWRFTPCHAQVRGVSVLSNIPEFQWNCQVLGCPVERRAFEQTVNSVIAISRDHRWLATAGDDHTIRVWNRSTREIETTLVGHEDWIRCLAFSRRGDFLVSAAHDGQLLQWSLDTREMSRVVPRELYSYSAEAIPAISLSPDDSTLGFAAFGGQIRLLDLERRQSVVELEQACPAPTAMGFSPDGTVLAAGGRNGRLHVWDLETGQRVVHAAMHQRRIRDFCFSSDGSRILSVGDDGQLSVLDWQGARQPRSFPLGPKLFSICVLGQGRVAIGGADNLIRIVSLDGMNLAGVLKGHTGTVTSLAYHEGELISTSFDTTVRVWEVDGQLEAPDGTLPTAFRSERGPGMGTNR